MSLKFPVPADNSLESLRVAFEQMAKIVASHVATKIQAAAPGAAAAAGGGGGLALGSGTAGGQGQKGETGATGATGPAGAASHWRMRRGL